MASLLTLVMLSPRPVTPPPPPDGAQWLVHVSTFGAEGLMAARLAALAKVRTPMFCFVDLDDALLHVPASVPRGLLYGEEEVLDFQTGEREIMVAQPWSQALHLQKPLLIHRAIFNTEAAQAVAQLLPEGLYMEWLLYYFVAAWRGTEMVNQPIYHWVRQDYGLHRQVRSAMHNSLLWIMQNQTKVLAKLRLLDQAP